MRPASSSLSILRRIRLHAVLGTLLASLTLMLGTNAAHAAGTYVNLSCSSGAGIGDAYGGWSGFSRPTVNGVDVQSPCPTGGLRVQMQPAAGYSVPVGGSAGWAYQAPPDTYITRLAAQLGGWVREFNGYNRGLIDVTGQSGRLAGFFDSSSNTVLWPTPLSIDAAGLHDTSLRATLWCDGNTGVPDCPGGVNTGWMALFAPRVYLADDAPPSVDAASGAASTETTWKGNQSLAYAASDKGGGIARFRLYVDGSVAIDHVIDTFSGRCAVLSTESNGAWVFGYPKPCPGSVDTTEAIDSTAINDGTHTIVATVLDASQRSATIINRSDILVANHPPVLESAPTYTDGNATRPLVGTSVAVDGNGNWSGPNLTYTHAWERCDSDGANCAQLPTATGLSYAPTDADLGHTLRFAVTATNVADSITTVTPATGLVATPSSVAPPTLKPSDPETDPTAPGVSAPALPTPLNATEPAGEHLANGQIDGHPAGEACPGGLAVLTWEDVSGGRVRVGYGRTATARVELTCRSTGKAIDGARLEIATEVPGRGAAASDATTDHDGHAVLPLERGPSRGITVGYRMYSDDPLARATATLKVAVRGRVRIKGSPRRLRNGQAVTLRGSVLGGFVPKRGVALTVQWRDGRRWRPFAQIKTTRNGRFRYAYRFTRSPRKVTYRLRVQVSRGQVDYPYEAAASRAVKVTVGG